MSFASGGAMKRIIIVVAALVLSMVFPQFTFSSFDKVSDKWLNCKVALIPVCFSDVPPTLTIDQVDDAFKNLKVPDSMASFVNSMSYGKFMLDFGSFEPKKWLVLKKKRMDYWIEKSKYNWEVLTKEFIDDTLALAKQNGLDANEYDKDKNGIPDYYIIFTAGSSTQDVHWYAKIVNDRDNYEIYTEEHDIYKIDKPAWTNRIIEYYFWNSQIKHLDSIDKEPIGMWDITVTNKAYDFIGVNSFNRWKLGLIEYKQITEPGTYEIDDLNGDGLNKGYMIKMPGTKYEWILIENRQKSGLDGLLDGIPGTGIVMYHYDNEKNYDYNFNHPNNFDDENNPRFGLKIFDNADDKIHKDAVWSADVGKTEMSWRNSKDNEPLFVKNYTGLHVLIKNISKSGTKMTFDLAYENNSPEYITDTKELDFGNVRKGLKKKMTAKFFNNYKGEIDCSFKTFDHWIAVDKNFTMLGNADLAITIDTENLDFGHKQRKVEYMSTTAVGSIKILVNVTNPVGDVNGDLIVDVNDFELFKNQYGKTSSDEGFLDLADSNGDQKVDLDDFFLFSKYFEAIK